MSARSEFELTEEQLAVLLDASKPTMAILIGGVSPPTPQQNANAAWRRLADEMGFDWSTVQAVAGKGDRFFTAVSRAVSPSRNQTSEQ